MMRLLHKILYEATPYGTSQYSVELLDHKFSDVKFLIGEVKFVETGDNFTLKYVYDIIEGKVEDSDKKEFEHTIGDLLIQMMDDGVRMNNLIYSGGKDEN